MIITANILQQFHKKKKRKGENIHFLYLTIHLKRISVTTPYFSELQIVSACIYCRLKLLKRYHLKLLSSMKELFQTKFVNTFFF